MGGRTGPVHWAGMLVTVIIKLGDDRVQICRRRSRNRASTDADPCGVDFNHGQPYPDRVIR
jgi:hypothetical protein